MSDVVPAPAVPALDPELIGGLRARLEQTRARVRQEAFALPPHRGQELANALTDAVDDLLRALIQEAEAAVGRADGPEAQHWARQIEVLALGGYGRRELCPHSDLDLLFLLPSTGTPGVVPKPGQAFVEAVLYGLWDLGFEVGHAVRSVEDTLLVAREDASVLTSLLDLRLVARRPDVPALAPWFAQLTRRLERELLRGAHGSDLVRAKLDEVSARRSRFGQTVFLLEPNVKDGEGGLRDLHAALWVARVRWRTGGWRELVRLGVLSSREGLALDRAYGFVLRVRVELHFAAKRKQDHLRFEYQEQIAPHLGYVDPTELDQDRRTAGVERFMRAYYFHARQLAHHAGLLVERATSHARRRAVQAVGAPRGFKLWDGKLTVGSRAQFLQDPSALVRIFRVAQDENLEIYSYTKNLITEHAQLIDRAMRRAPEVVRTLLAILDDPKSDGAIFEEMHDLGILRRLVPEWARVQARWQHSLYHVYTVDVHSLEVLKNLRRLRRGDFIEAQPEMTRRIADLPRLPVLLLAGLLHDVGKGWPRGDHSVRGERVARVVGRRLEAAGLPAWTAEETEDTAWLVRQHLAMSDISQRRDLSDPDLIAAFAADVATEERLTMLYLLTFADMRGTSPSVWTDWKGGLLRELYHSTRRVLEHRAAGSTQVDLHFEARRRWAEQDLAEEAGRQPGLSLDPAVVRAFAQGVPARYMLSFHARRMVRHVQMWRDVSRRGGLAIHVRHLRRDGMTKLTVACTDRPGLLALLAGTLASHRLQILSAQVFSLDALEPAPGPADPPPEAPGSERVEAYSHLELTIDRPVRGRVALDVLFVADENGRICDDPARWVEVRADLRAVVLRDEDVHALVARRLGRSSLAPRHRPHVKTRVTLAPEASRHETVLDVFCEDRIGALYTIARVFTEQGLSISLAKISTQGHQVADGFYVTDARTGAKIEDRARLSSLLEALRTALRDEEDFR